MWISRGDFPAKRAVRRPMPLLLGWQLGGSPYIIPDDRKARPVRRPAGSARIRRAPMGFQDVAAYRGKVDFGILTIREDEYKAVLRHLSGRITLRGEGFYEYARLGLDTEGDCGVAVARSLEQGHGSSHDRARDLIADLDPRWILLVGIAGGMVAD